MDIVEIDKQFSLERSGKNEMFYLQNICSICGWKGSEHYAYNNYQHSNCKEERQRHRQKRCGSEESVVATGACCSSPGKDKCEQCQEVGSANPNNH